ncbi:Ribonucleoside-diphosphate reductase small chain C [Raphanus sativus]|nr:Ribonucleoside-diphosphate reductase small chain C [Raphanus sativus]
MPSMAEEPLLTPTQTDSACSRSTTRRSGRCTRKPKPPSGPPRKSTSPKTPATGSKTSTTASDHFVKHVLAFFAASDGIVLENLASRFMSDVQVSEARAFYGFQIAIENPLRDVQSPLRHLHQRQQGEGPSLPRDRDDPLRKEKGPMGLEVDRWASGLRREDRGVRLRGRDILQGASARSSGSRSEGSCRAHLLQRAHLESEGLHCDFAVIYSLLRTKLSEERVRSIVCDAVEIEREFVCDALPCALVGMNRELMSQYIEFVADRLLGALGCGKVYGVANPV